MKSFCTVNISTLFSVNVFTLRTRGKCFPCTDLFFCPGTRKGDN